LALTLLRSRMKESRRWEETRLAKRERLPISTLFQKRYLTSILGLVGMYGFWNLWAGTNGFFFPYILRTMGAATQAQSVAIQALNFAIGIVSIYFVSLPRP
jgi:MFS transporter, SP family, inositol transporter